MNNDKPDIKVRDFKPTTWALKNKNTIYLLIFVLCIFGGFSYMTLPKELFPEVNFPTAFVSTVYPGNSPEDMENLVTIPLEKELQSLDGLKSLSSTSVQDVSFIFVEFNSDIQIDDVLQDVKDAVDDAMSELPTDLLTDPTVTELDFSKFPIININLSGEYNTDELKVYAEYLQDEFEEVFEVSQVDIKGLNDKEIQINIDFHKMEAFDLSFTTIENAVAYENMTISGGEIKMGDTRRSVRIIGEFETVDEIENIVVKSEDNNVVYLKDVAEVVDGYAEPKSFARLDNQTVVSLQVIKKNGENLLQCIDEINEKLEAAKESGFLPEELTISITGDQSKQVRNQLSNLENSMIMGILFVVGVLFFFLGFRNSLLVGAAIPLSMLLSFVIFGIMGTTINMIVLFSLILALGMLVDNAIVVVENIYRYVDEGVPIKEAARKATGEIAIPIIASTATTLAAFTPLAFGTDMVAEFMKYLPITLIIVLTSSLFVALVITPVLGARFIKSTEERIYPNKKKVLLVFGIMAGVALVFYALKVYLLANLLMIAAVFILLNSFILLRVARRFQKVFLPWLEDKYLKFITFTLKGNNPKRVVIGTFILLVGVMIFFQARQPEVDFFPNNEPQYINVITELPIGSDLEYTDSIAKIFEKDINTFLVPYDDIIESVQTTVGEGVARENEFAIGNTAHKTMITIKFVDYNLRQGVNTSDIMQEITEFVHNKYAGMSVFVEKNRMGPPTGSPINIELSGDDMQTLISLSDTLIAYIEDAEIDGIENLKIDIETGKPELEIEIDRENTRRFGLSTAQIATSIRTALFGKEISDFKIDDEEYPIQLRYDDEYRYDLASLMNQKITFRNNKGMLLKIPISSVASFKYSSSYGQVKRNDQVRTVTIYSNVIEGYNSTKINQLIKLAFGDLDLPEGYDYKFTGEQEDMQSTMDFLVTSMMIAMALIMIILVAQFNSVTKPLIILSSVLLSTIGVFGGLAIFNMDFVIMMTGIGIVSLAGVVVNNAIVLMDYIDILKLKKKQELGIDEDDNLEISQIIPLIIEAGKTRLRPVLLTAITTILGLFPMAVGFNIDFEGMLTNFKPDIYFGGDMAGFWGPMSWTVIFGLTFATFLTLIVVPSMYLMGNKSKLKSIERRKKRNS